jgi:very-short-patch-repair endonuclease
LKLSDTNDPPSPPRGSYDEAILLEMKELEKPMYFGARADTLAAAKILLRKMTVFEKLIWERLNQKKVSGIRFRRQHPISFFIVDFYCHKARLVIEIDGRIQSQQRDYDDGRSAEMEKYNIRVIRFANEEVDSNIEDVIKRIEYEVKRRIKSPHWGIQGWIYEKAGVLLPRIFHVINNIFSVKY